VVHHRRTKSLTPERRGFAKAALARPGMASAHPPARRSPNTPKAPWVTEACFCDRYTAMDMRDTLSGRSGEFGVSGTRR
jgi:hypothetical protein